MESLPAGWLGKPHALQKGYERSTGEWLIFTDADVHFAPDLLRRSVALAEQQQWDHMPLFGTAKMFTIGERIAMTFFALCFLLNVRPWHVSNPRSRFYAGIGAFQLIRRSAYEAIGTHRRLAMEVVDDMKLGKLVKDGGVPVWRGEGGRRGERSLARGRRQHHSRDDEEFFCDGAFSAVGRVHASDQHSTAFRISRGGDSVRAVVGRACLR